MDKFNYWLAAFFALIGAGYLTLALRSLTHSSISLVITATFFAGVAAGIFLRKKWAWHVAYALLLIPLMFIPIGMITKAAELRVWEIILGSAFFLVCLVVFTMLKNKKVRRQYGVACSFEDGIAEKMK